MIRKDMLCTELIHCKYSIYFFQHDIVIWPSGTYGLPKAETGCPEGGVTWSEGWWKQDMEDTGISRSEISSNSHMDAKFVGDKKDINRTFCMKTRPGNSKKLWPKGIL